MSVQVNDLWSLSSNQDVTATVKVKSVDPAEKVKNRNGDLDKQDCVVADTCRVVRRTLDE